MVEEKLSWYGHATLYLLRKEQNRPGIASARLQVLSAWGCEVNALRLESQFQDPCWSEDSLFLNRELQKHP